MKGKKREKKTSNFTTCFNVMCPFKKNSFYCPTWQTLKETRPRWFLNTPFVSLPFSAVAFSGTEWRNAEGFSRLASWAAFVKRMPAPGKKTNKKNPNPTAQFLGISPFGMWPGVSSLCFLTGMLEICKKPGMIWIFLFYLREEMLFVSVSLPRTMSLDVCERCDA